MNYTRKEQHRKMENYEHPEKEQTWIDVFSVLYPSVYVDHHINFINMNIYMRSFFESLKLTDMSSIMTLKDFNRLVNSFKLSIPTCFPQRNSIPSTTATPEGISLRNSSNNTRNSSPQHAVVVQFNHGINQAEAMVLPSPIQNEAVSRPTVPDPQTLPTSFLRPS